MKSSKQLSLIGAAVAAALGTNAYALGPSSWSSLSAVYYTGGGSAEVQAVYSAVLRCLASSTVDVYTDGTGSTKHPQSQSYLILSGTTNGTCGATGQNIGFFYKYNGGSFPNGVQPQLSSGSTLLAYPTTASLAVATAQSGFSGTVSSVNPDYTFTSAPTGSIQPDWGISDEEGALFAFLWNANNATNVHPGTITNGTGLWVAPFGIAVTANVFAQKKIWTRGEVAAVYQGPNGPYGITAWSQLTADNGSPMTLAGGINVLDRGSGSGTKAAVNQYFLDYPASGSSAGGANPPNSVGAGNVNLGYTGSALVTSGAATSSYQDIKEGSSVSITDDLNAAQTAGIGAIGALGLEFPPLFEQATAGTNSYDFVAINGVYPDTQNGTTDNINSPTAGTTHYTNVVNGTYDFATQVGYQAKNPPAAGTFEAGVVNNLKASTISGAATGSAFPTSAEGVLLDPVTTLTTTAGNVNWSKGGNTAASPVFATGVAAAAAVPLASQ